MDGGIRLTDVQRKSALEHFRFGANARDSPKFCYCWIEVDRTVQSWMQCFAARIILFRT
jgi:hypothetical protein